MRVGYLGHLVTEQNLGVGQCILRLGRALARTRGRNELVFYIRTEGPWIADGGLEPTSPGVSLAVRPTRHRLERILWEQLALPERARRQKIELLHAPGYTLPLATRVPTVLTIYDLLAFSHPRLCRPETRWHYRLLLPRSIRRARQVVVPSHSVAAAIQSRFGIASERISVVVPGIDRRFFRKPQPEELGVIQRKYRLPSHFVFFAGNLEPKKNLPRLIAAFQEARREGLEGELLFAGGAGWGTDLARPSPGDGVRWLGYIPDEDLPALFRLASEVAFPALAEGLGMPVLEALATETVVVASAVPAVDESDPAAVVPVDPFSVPSIARGLLTARRNLGLRRRLIERGRRAVAALTWERAAAETWAVYREVLAR